MKISDFWLYRWRYPLGLMLISSILTVLLVTAVLYIPGGISAQEMAAVEKTAGIDYTKLFSMNSGEMLNLPYHLTQQVSIANLGVSVFSIKLPSLIGAVLSVLAIYGFLRLWFRRNVAISTTVIVVVSALFLYSTQLGIPMIAYIAYPAMLLLFSAMLSHSKKMRPFWFLSATVIAGASLYTPLQIYGIVALISTAFIHPHARFVVMRLPKWSIAIGLAAFSAIVAPLVMSIVKDPAGALPYLGFSSPIGLPDINHLKEIAGQLTGLSPAFGLDILSPVYGYGLLLLAAVGVYRLFTAKYTAKSYILTIWLALTAVPFLFSKDVLVYSFVPIVALAAFGIDHLFRSWYQLFPVNPYARVGGLLPLGAVVLGLIVAGMVQFTYGFHYSSQVNDVFSSDIKILSEELQKHDKVSLVTSSESKGFYDIFAKNNGLDSVSVTTGWPQTESGTVIVSQKVVKSINRKPNYIVVDSGSNAADRFYVYTSEEK